jgi:PPOX class probable F420-dependent enzyme
MAAELNDVALDLLSKTNFAHLGTLMPDGSPQVNPVWVDQEGGKILINSAEGRQKVHNMRRDPRVSVEVSDSGDPYKFVEIRGRVVEMTNEGADEHIDQLAKKYLGVDEYPYRQADEVRVKIVIEPDKVIVSGG